MALLKVQKSAFLSNLEIFSVRSTKAVEILLQSEKSVTLALVASLVLAASV